MTGLLQSSITGDVSRSIAIVAGLAVVAGMLSALVSIGYRWYVRERAPTGLPVLVGLSGVVLSLNTGRALSQVISGTAQPFDETAALFNVAAVLVSAAAARAAIDVGDRIGSDVFVATGGREVQADVGRMVQAVGRVITVEIPDEIEDIVGYDPVPDETKAKLAGRTFVFPRRLTVEALRDRLVTRLKADYAVGHVDVDLTAEGEIEYLAVGSRAAGIGPTLPPETSAVAIRADPAFSASAGDVVQVWRTDPPERLLTAEVRGVADDVVTLAVDAADTRRLDDDTEYKLVTLPVEKRADREFVSLFRAADETMAAVEISPGSTLAGQSLEATGVTVVAVRSTDGPVEPLPSRDRTLAGGETVYVVATPDAIRRLEVAAASDPAGADVSAGATLPPEHRVGPGESVPGDADSGTGASGNAADAGGDSGDESTVDAGVTANEPDADEDLTAEDVARPAEDPSLEEQDVPSGDATPGTVAPGEAPTPESEPGDALADDWGPPGEIAIDPETRDDANATPSGETDDGPPGEDGDSPDDDSSTDGEDTARAADDPDREDLDTLPGTDVADLSGADEVLDDADDLLSDSGGRDGGPDEGPIDGDDGADPGDGSADGEADPGDGSADGEADPGDGSADGETDRT